MPRLHNDQLDEEPLTDGTLSFVGGMVSAVRPDQLPDNAVAYARNCVIADNGELQTRRGCVLIGEIFEAPGGGGT